MDRQEAFEFLIEHYEQPRHRGELADPDVTMPGGNPGCGDVVTIYLKVDSANDAIQDVAFVGEGCTISQAAASILLEQMQGQSLTAVEGLDFNWMIDELGREVVQSRPRCATLALGTLKAAIKKYRNDQIRAELGAESAQTPPETFSN
ncbi:iron-sulfur cluster assembly scaffold protein [Herpetosiphon geysericola]|uniref:Nitrogen fixation protein NifU n=1 Tax=Herpetosiphon geysericola TaxID=70996 RepID=A0A0P6Y1Z7_9CHLR|nr:iron-sulfur cluster assembly scaffold protein [Herpetosiphon geysericola]KPL91665.1 nitrogen fixation protein NifU [Herpetosiphon geysericola]